MNQLTTYNYTTLLTTYYCPLLFLSVYVTYTTHAHLHIQEQNFNSHLLYVFMYAFVVRLSPDAMTN